MGTAPNSLPNNRTTQQVRLQKMIAGLQKHGQALPVLVIAGATYKTADLVAALQQRLDATTAVDTTRGLWRNAVKADHDQRAKTKVLVAGLRQALLAAFGASIDTLSDFGLVAHKPPAASPGTRGLAVQKAKATRAARHTLGSRQRAKIKGTLPQASTAAPVGPSVVGATDTLARASAPSAPAPGQVAPLRQA